MKRIIRSAAVLVLLLSLSSCSSWYRKVVDRNVGPRYNCLGCGAPEGCHRAHR